MPPHLLRQPVNVLLELPPQPRLPHPRRPGHQHQPRHPPLRRRMEQLLDRPQLRVPPHQRRLQPVNPLHPAYPGQHPHRPPQNLRLRLPLQPVLPPVSEPDPATRQTLRRPIRQHLPRPRRRLHPRRRIHRIPRHHPLTHRPQSDRHLTSHHPGPRCQPRRPCLVPELAHRADEFQRGAHGPLRVPFRGDGRSPHRHHRIPDKLLHHPAVPANHHPRHLEVPRQQLPHRLRIPRLRQRRKPHQITKQNRAHPPLRHRAPGRLSRHNRHRQPRRIASR